MKDVIVEHNESGEMLSLTVPEDIEPVICFTEFFCSGSALLYLKDGEPFYTPIPCDEEMSAEEFGHYIVEIGKASVYTRKDAEEHSEWIDTVVEMHRKGEL